MANTGIHITHCCALHGCKYGKTGCPVENLQRVQSGNCQFCDDEEGDLQFVLQIQTPDGRWLSGEAVYGSVAQAVDLFLFHDQPGAAPSRVAWRSVQKWRPI
ncbi:MAG: hypothetical protein WC054_00635 [Candidatus Nanopelagicales bacterium]